MISIQIDVTADTIDQGIATIECMLERQIAPLDEQDIDSDMVLNGRYGTAEANAMVSKPEPISFGLSAEETQELDAVAALPL